MTVQRSPIKRAAAWVWQGDKLRALRSDRPKGAARQVQLLARSHAAIALARTALEPPLPANHGAMDGFACELYRQATYWALLAQRVPAEPDPPRESLQALFQSVDRKVLEHAAGDAKQLELIESAVASKDFADLAELPQAEQVRLAQRLQPFAEALAAGIDARELAIQRIWMRRLVVFGVVLALIVGSIWGARVLARRAEIANDLAVGKAWTASSLYPAGCTSPEQSCGSTLGFFVHTNEEPNPWLMFDLEKVTEVSGLRIVNRTDCCQDRGLPLVIEVSSDQKAWQEVARRTTQFLEWKPDFDTTEARYVRLRVEGTGILHLSQVRILP